MVFSSTVFLFVFLPAVLIFYFLGKNRTYRNIILLLASIVFYAWGEPLFVFVMIATVFVNWGLGLGIDKDLRKGRKGKIFLIPALVLDLEILGVFKYLTFITKNIAFLTGHKDLIINITLPIGISFFTFQMMSYVLDVYFQHAEAQRNPFDVLLYIAMFPQLIAGPIVRYETVATDIKSRTETRQGFTQGMIRFVYGLGKKLLIANYLGSIADVTFNSDTSLAVLTAWLGAICYTLQIYFDFSGYSDMAIGLGLIFGFHFPENFNYPYISKSINGFWRRWHISLSTWFRDYLYIPLGGNRVSKGWWIFNLFIVWLLTGIWHGANWTFIAWGLFYFCFLLLEKLIGIERFEKHGVLSHIYTMVIVIILWALFRSDSITAAGSYIGSMFGIGAAGIADSMTLDLLSSGKVILILGVILSTPLYRVVRVTLSERSSNIFDGVATIVIFCLCVLNVVSATYNPFIYFNF